jgi:lipoyl(octanoyl) transferase
MLKIHNLGLIDYLEAYDFQKEQVELVKSGQAESLIVCSHPSVVTLGKKSTQEDLLGWEGDIYNIERGGKATYHGPGQVVIYPVIDLKKRGQNIAGFLEVMEEAMIAVLKELEISASGNPERGKPDYTGVWVEATPPKKIASIGVAVSRWVTFHGLAFNLHSDPSAFKGISPCGFTTETMTDLETLLNKRLERSNIEQALIIHLQSGFSKLLV